ncbi:LysR family transcriptional regulator [Mesorhizobium sp. CU2]|uniref:LysR family transcriptional regulator n=1 Tax=unclassified Mesorhizobium TaxID=325217 RepID=UPI001125CE18|nr:MULTISPECIES: LysR family transcriptional regulator [unclassified Mesorhizobium]TPN79589.1 LysR family transcriptional regulator [Mesorhizobium sp. CU3]TPO20062.1 LysR family transcriptional regulator [Mesorhizobium sp. CU2]
MLHQIDLSRIDLNLLVLFETVMEERHVGRSASRLNLSPSAVSHGLGRLRGLLGDPLFLRTPRGVVPTDRALELAAPVAEILARVRSVVASAEPFDPARTKRRFVIGAPDGASAVFLPPLLEVLHRSAPGIDIGIRQLLPRQNETSPLPAWGDVIAELEARLMDVAVIPIDNAPERLLRRPLYEEDFVVAMRAGHRFARDTGIEAYCAMEHLVVSQTADAQGFVDIALAAHGLSRRIALTVPNFMFALAVLAETDFVSALPRRFVATHAPRFGVIAVDAPLVLPRFQISAVVPKVAMMDAGIAWLVGQLEQAARETQLRGAD